ncbi:MAG: PD40 domain-containing protein [Ignavibacteriales bacterium]|nr:PD40 domain-containing protein [Ignavibacteriales bacterium]
MRIIVFIILLLFFAEQSSAQIFSFGRNKVQYTEFDWHVLKTEHFDVYYYPEMEELARYGAHFAEESYKLLEQKFNHNVAYRVPLVFYSSHLHFEQTNITPGLIPEGVGGFFEFLKGRVVIPFNGSLANFKHVIRHELVHVFTHSKINRVLLDHRQTQDRLPPLWFTEGLAEYWSDDWDTQAEMVLRDATLNNYLVPLSIMDRISGTYLMYKEGQAVLEFLSKVYGEEKILLLMENFWRANSFEEVFTYVVGDNYKKFDEVWTYALKKKYYPLLSTNDFVSRAAEPLTRDGFNSKPVFFRRGEKREIYFIGNYTGYTGIYRRSLDSLNEKPELLIEGERTEEYEAFHFFQSKMDISLDGTLAFTAKRGETDALNLFDVEKKKEIASYQFQGLVLLSSPSFSPDGNEIVFSGVDKSGFSDLYIFLREKEELLKITDDVYSDRDAVFSRDGKQIYFSSDRTSTGEKGYSNIFALNRSTFVIEYITYGAFNFTSPSFSADGKNLCFVSDRDGARNIYLIPTENFVDSSRYTFPIKQITRYVTAAFDPVFTDSNELVFASFENFRFQLHSLSLANVQDSVQQEILLSVLPTARQWKPTTYQDGEGIESRKYKGDYAVDIAQSQISTQPFFGTVGGAFIGLSDVLGNDRYNFLVFNTAQTQSEVLQSFNIIISRTSLERRSNYSYGIFRFSGPRYDITDPDVFFYERSFGGFFELSYPLSSFQRLEFSTSIINSNKETYGSISGRKALFLSNGISYVFDNSLWGPSGPLDGNRFSTIIAYSSDVQNSNANYYSFIFDFRKYFRIAQRSSFATRMWFFLNEGQEARRFFMGGSWDLRGFRRWSLRGRNLWLMSNELRFPFLDELHFRFPIGSVAFVSFRGAVFFDLGSVWDTKYKQTLGSFGVGWRLNFANALVLRYDIGKRLENNLSKLSNGLFYQFFFGWDF